MCVLLTVEMQCPLSGSESAYLRALAIGRSNGYNIKYI